jgi:hypothetical protein
MVGCEITLVTPVSSRTNLAYVVVDTGQSKCYDDKMKISCPQRGDSFHGQDAQYTRVEPRYVDNGDGTVTDLNTGLMWQKNPGAKKTYEDAIQNVSIFQLGGYDDWRLPDIKELYSLIMFSGKDVSSCMMDETCSGTPFLDTRFFDFEYGDTSAGERIIDSQYMSSTEYVSRTILGNLSSETQNTHPDLAKASSILAISEDVLKAALGPPHPDFSVAAKTLGISEQDLIAALESVDNFSSGTASTEDGLSQGNETVFGVNFADGRIKGYPKTIGPNPMGMFARYVRGNTAYGINNYSDNGDGTITDEATELMWMKTDSNTALNWENALAYCEDFDGSGLGDYRMPRNFRVLSTILDLLTPRLQHPLIPFSPPLPS